MREPSTISLQIKQELKNQGKTQVWLSEKTGIQAGYLSELINGHPKKRWNADTLKKVSEALNRDFVSFEGASPVAVLEKIKQSYEGDPVIEGLTSSLMAAIKERGR